MNAKTFLVRAAGLCVSRVEWSAGKESRGGGEKESGGTTGIPSGPGTISGRKKRWGSKKQTDTNKCDNLVWMGQNKGGGSSDQRGWGGFTTYPYQGGDTSH